MQRHRLWRLPVIRGVIALGESLAIGFRALAISANYAAQSEDDEGEVKTEISRGQIIFSFAIAIGFALMLFKVGPALLTSWLPIDGTTWFVVVEGLIRVAVFIAYIALIGLIPDLKRVFQYHAAEHKAINALEAGAELSPKNVQKFSLIHPRCGTAFLLWVMVIGIFVFALVGRPSLPYLVGSRILLLPVIAGLAYELIRFAGKHQSNRLLRVLLAPGLWLQRLDASANARPDRGLDSRAAGGATTRGRRVRRAAPRGAKGRGDGLMPRIVRVADATWEGSVARGAGTVTAASSGAFSLPVTIASRIGDPDGKTSPEELLAAAHAGCFITSLGSELARAGHPPERIELTCTITMDEVEGQGHQIVASAIVARARVPGADDTVLDAARAAADAGCPFLEPAPPSRRRCFRVRDPGRRVRWPPTALHRSPGGGR